MSCRTELGDPLFDQLVGVGRTDGVKGLNFVVSDEKQEAG
jgi:hypothetical protein